MTKSVQYDQSQIIYYKGLEGVRKRPQMYIVDTAMAGLHQLVFELVDNSIDEAMAGSCNFIQVILEQNNSVTVIDNGRGIPVEMHDKEGMTSMELVLTKLHAGGKMDDKSAYKISGGTHGVGLSVVNALSEWLQVYSSRNGAVHFMEFRQGAKHTEMSVVGETNETGTKVNFKPDASIFVEGMDFSMDFLASRLRELSYLNKGITIELADYRKEEPKIKQFHFDGGIQEFVAAFNENKQIVHDKPIYYHGTVEDVDIEYALQYNSDYEQTIFCYANNIRNPDGGTHLIGFKTALTREMNNFITKLELDKKFKHQFTGDDVREGLVAVISVKLTHPQFQSQAKNKLVNTSVKRVVETAVTEGLQRFYDEDPHSIAKILKKAMVAFDAREAARKARDAARGRKSAMNSGSLPGKLADCTDPNPENCELYLVEGDSAGGSAAQGRDRKFQAILPLWGKMLNVEKASISGEEKIFENDKLQPVIATLGTGLGEDLDLSKLRYHKVIIMADADVDGSHIRTLLLTFFFRYFKKLLEAGHIYVACPPLFRLQHGKQVRYAYSDAERDSILKEMTAKNVSIQRYKGLGEMNPDQLWETTMDPMNRKIIQIKLDDRVEAEHMVDVLLGPNVEPRRRFIEEHATYVKNLDI